MTIEYDPQIETLDGALNNKLRLIQPKSGYRFSMDAVLLAHFARPGPVDTAVDLGTGCGVIALLLLAQGKARHCTGIEIQTELADLARRNSLAESLAKACRIIHGDLREIVRFIEPQSVELVSVNPPFHAVGSGRDNPNKQISLARHEHACTMRDVVHAAALVLSGLGKAILIYPAERLFELFRILSDEKLPARRIRLVHGKAGEQARLVLVEAARCKGSSILVESPLILAEKNGDQTPEAERIFSGNWT